MNQIKYFFLTLMLTIPLLVAAQITTVPELPVPSEGVTITFNSAEESRLGYYTGDLYAHTGVFIEDSTGWQHVIGDWGMNAEQPQLTHLSDGIYELEITPDINSFYSVKEGEKVLRMAFVFRSADANQQTDDLFVDVYEEGLVVNISQPSDDQILPMNQPVSISGTSSFEADLRLFLNEMLLTENTGTSVSADYTFAESGNNLLIAEAVAGDETVRDSVSVYIREEAATETIPAAYRKGINYPTDTSAALVLWAPLKEFVFVLGDFNNWKPQNSFQMNKDGDYFWLEIPGLEKGKEYAFQYLIDGEIRIADPYAEKILDPWNDQDIEEETYPNLMPYPQGETEGVVSVLQSGQEEYQWQVTDFQIPKKEKLVIYELLIRDFTAEHSFKAVREKLDYLEDLNINVLELMPVNEFEGNSSWGYNPSFYFAPDKYYGPKNELKKLIDECHQRGIAVVIDMVLNHSYGQSPFVQMYMDNWTITPENPWYNEVSNFDNPNLRWGYDFNHESEAAKELVDSVNSFWMNEYKIDGFRFDFTKGFSNTPYDSESWGSEYDADRIANLKRMATEIRERNEDAIIIFEHLADNSEEKELADYNILLWGNMHGNYLQAARGNTGSSDLSWGIYSERNWVQPNLIAYPESHDEERIIYEIKLNGLAADDYNIKNQQTALDRIELNAVFYLPLPGPKMIWQFGERGYDISINAFGGRLSEKPPYWHYLDNSNRTDLFRVMAKLNYLKQNYTVFIPQEFDYVLTGQIKWYVLKHENSYVLAVGNFGIQEEETELTFPTTGKWHRFFTNDSVQLDNVVQSVTLAPGEFRLYSTQKFIQPDISTENSAKKLLKEVIRIYPNPADDQFIINGLNVESRIEIYSLTGRLMYQSESGNSQSIQLNLKHFQPGLYIVSVFQNGERITQKLVVK
ncbi:MAG: alpha-amylase family glycosyl hydrolase [Bacteroidota bacterium]